MGELELQGGSSCRVLKHHHTDEIINFASDKVAKMNFENKI